jgi:hypothetical protein
MDDRIFGIAVPDLYCLSTRWGSLVSALPSAYALGAILRRFAAPKRA